MPRKPKSRIAQEYKEACRYASPYFNKEDFSGVKTHKEKFIDAVFMDCTFNDATFVKCHFEYCIINTTAAIGLKFVDCTFDHCTFDYSDLSVASFTGSTLSECSMRHIGMNALTFLTASKVVRCDFSGCSRPYAPHGSRTGLPETYESLACTYLNDPQLGGWIVYRDEIGPQTKIRQPKDWVFEPGRTLVEVCDMDRWRVCGPGIAFTQLRYCTSDRVWMCVVPERADICIPYFHQHGRASALQLIKLMNTSPAGDDEIPF